MVQIAVLGHGVVGSGVVEVIRDNQKQVAKKAGDAVNVKRILDLRDFDVDYADRFTKDFQTILNDAEISVVAEVMGGCNPAYQFTKSALQAGKSVVTSNKELVATHGAELMQIAKAHNVNYFFEASVGGGIPIIKPMVHCLDANQIQEVAGILNGTTNFILSKMIHENMAFDVALKIAQDLGYAEKDPTADVEGEDACRKICILAGLAFGKQVKPSAVATQGITKISDQDVAYAKQYNSVIKLIGRAKQQEDGSVFCSVSPMVVPKTSPLAVIEDVFNGVLVRGNAVGEVMFYGPGAGKLPTASAVVSDILDAITANGTDCSGGWEDDGVNHVVDAKTELASFMVRFDALVATEKLEAVFKNITLLSDDSASETALIACDLTAYDLLKGVEQLAQDGIFMQSHLRLLGQ